MPNIAEDRWGDLLTFDERQGFKCFNNGIFTQEYRKALNQALIALMILEPEMELEDIILTSGYTPPIGTITHLTCIRARATTIELIIDRYVSPSGLPPAFDLSANISYA